MIDELLAELEQWQACSARQWSHIVAMNEEITDLKLEIIRADARLTVLRGEILLAAHPVPQCSPFDEPELAESP